MASDINPTLTPTKSLTNFRFWCQKVLPLVYDDSLSYYEVLGKMVVQLNDVIDDVNADIENVDTLKEAFLALQTYVNEFFDDIDQLASYAERAEAAQTAANQSAINASESATNASASSLAAMNARDAAVTARQAAETSANTASTAAMNANTKASEATQSAITAQTAQASASQSATLAATDRSAAQTAASTATAKASEANASAENAAQSKEDAEEAANNIQENLDNIQQNTQDINDLKESIVNKAPIIVNTASGTIAHFKDGAENMPVKALSIDGTESANIIRTGKNLIDPSTYNFQTITRDGLTYTVQKSGAIKVEGTATATGGPELVSAIDLPHGTYSYLTENFQNVRCAYRGRNIGSEQSFALLNPFVYDGSYQIYINLFCSAVGTYDLIIHPQIELDSTPSAYEPYQSETFEYPSEPVTTLYGVNNIWSNEGEINVTYRADTKLYIDNKIGEVQALMLENLGG